MNSIKSKNCSEVIFDDIGGGPDFAIESFDFKGLWDKLFKGLLPGDRVQLRLTLTKAPKGCKFTAYEDVPTDED